VRAAADVTAWSWLALVVGVVHAAVGQAVLTIILAMVYLASMPADLPAVVLRSSRGSSTRRDDQAMMGAVFVAVARARPHS